jgi:peptide chain release factor subunit 1
VTRRTVEAALNDATRAVNALPADAASNGFALFASGDGAPCLLVPPEPLTGFVYRCEKTFFLAPLDEMLVPRSVVGLIVLDRGEATFGWTDGRRIVLLRNIESYIMPKHKKGGMSQARYARMTQQTVEAFFTKVGEEANATFLPLLGRMERLVVGGPALTKGEFMEGDYLDYRLRDRLEKQTVSTGYTDEQGLKELCVRAGLVSL